MRVLYLVPHVPNPTKIRSHFHVKGLLEAGHQVTVVTLERSEDDRNHIAKLQQSGAQVIWVRLPRWQSLLNTALALPTRLPLQAAFMWSPELLRQIKAHVQAEAPDIVHVEHLRMARYGLELVNDWPTVWDAVDNLESLYRQARTISSSRALRLISLLEAPRLEGYERELVGKFPATLVISEGDRSLFQKNNPFGERVKTALVGLPFIPLTTDTPRSDNTLIMTGTLNYHPNVASVHYFVRDIFPTITAQRPDIRLQLVGSKPSATIQQLASPQIEITGFVPSITDYLQKATVALAPVLYGSGVQIKVLEAFLTATPLVANSVALRGLDVRHEEHMLVADTPADFAAAVLRLLNDPDLRARLGMAGQRYVEQHHDLKSTTQRLVSIYEDVIQGK